VTPSGANGNEAAAVRGGTQRHEDYQRDKFGFDETSNEMICPQGRGLLYHHRSETKGREIYVYQAAAEDCRRCSARPKCCPNLNLKDGGRSVSFTLHDEAIEAFDE
jgi:hypothetical protein